MRPGLHGEDGVGFGDYELEDLAVAGAIERRGGCGIPGCGRRHRAGAAMVPEVGAGS
jgi:hypothetical protein